MNIKCSRRGLYRQSLLPYGPFQTLRYPAAWSYAALLASGSERGLSCLFLQDPLVQSSVGTLIIRQHKPNGRIAASIKTSGLSTDLSTLHVSPHSSLAPNCETSAVENGEHKNRERSKEKGDHSQDDGCSRLANGRWAGRRDVTLSVPDT